MYLLKDINKNRVLYITKYTAIIIHADEGCQEVSELFRGTVL